MTEAPLAGIEIAPEVAEAPSEPSLGQRVTLTGRKMLALAGMITVCAAAAPKAAEAQYDSVPLPGKKNLVGAIGNHSLAVVPVNFSNGSNRHLAFNAEDIDRALFTGTDSVSGYFSEVSFGQFQLTGNVLNPVTVPPLLKGTDCQPRDFLNIGKAANGKVAQRLGKNALSTYDDYMYVFPRQPNCLNPNIPRQQIVLNGQTIGNATFINSRPIQHKGIYVHELSHELGLSHANALHCTDNKGRPVLPPLGFSFSCREDIYQDPFDPMGFAARRKSTPIDFSAVNKARLGWLQPDNIQLVDNTATVEIAPDEVPSDQPQLIQIPYGHDEITGEPQYVYLDYRQPLGEDAKVAPHNPVAAMFRGVVIREAGPVDFGDPITLEDYTDLIDTHPQTPSMIDAPLTVGERYHDKSTGITIKTLGLTASGAEVRVKIPGKIR